jgi:hypothetical protein
MQNVVSLGPERPRPPRALGLPREGARILFFTGVRYCRNEDAAPNGGEEPSPQPIPSSRMLDAAAH